MGRQLLHRRPRRWWIAPAVAGLLVPMAAAQASPADEAAPAQSGRVSAGISNVVGSPIPPHAWPENHPRLIEQFHVEIENVTGGAIEHVALDGTRTHLGNVQRAATSTVAANDGFWASRYSRAVDGTAGHLLATSVYVLRSKVWPEESYDPSYYEDFDPAEDQRDWTTSLLNIRPDRYLGADHGHWLADTIYTDIPGGSAIFGGDSALPTGSPLSYYDEEQGSWRPIAEHFRDDPTKAPPQRLRFTANRPVSRGEESPSYLEFENWAAGDTVAGRTHTRNGRILVGYENGAPRHVADVVQRVAGAGRFGGTEFAQVGQMDTNHPGALTFSTSPYVGFTWDQNLRGGFQIVPANHVKFLSNDLGQNSFIGRPQWLIVGPVGADPSVLYDRRYIIDGELSFSPGWEAIAPVFGMYARTTFDADNLDESTYFEVSYDYGETWHLSPVLVGTHDPSTCQDATCPHNWTNIRVHLAYPAGP
ncbi:hypothetical protein E1262_08290 [Jiangella aurantiaca]|uniref:Uncharacterized protein n=1 Tax=Jiangella aurantiaca TaxID=2530373 RepID=A0A4R5AGX5_9ACTN|nr:hypothetical protein [Jiangella aurantiaca]TDD70650.1 hypothetical protein E1262_08290 [Jiangella aurantiaca]